MTTSNGWSNIFAGAALLAFSLGNPTDGSRAVAAPATVDSQETQAGASTRADLTYSLDPPAVPAGVRATLTIRLPEKDLQRSAGVDPDEAPEARDDLFLQAPGLLVLDHDLKKIDDTYVWTYQVTSYLPGRITLPPIEIRLGPQTFSTTAVPLQITSDRAEGDTELRPELPEVPFPFPWIRNLGLLAAALLGWYGYRRYRRWMAGLPPILVPSVAAGPPPESPDVWLKKRFAEIRARLERGEAQGTVDELTATLRGYYARVVAQPVTAWTTNEIRRDLGSDVHVRLLIPIFERCDRFLFTGEKTAPAAVAESCLSESERILCN